MHVVYEIPKGVLGVELTVRCKQVPLLSVLVAVIRSREVAVLQGFLYTKSNSRAVWTNPSGRLRQVAVK